MTVTKPTAATKAWAGECFRAQLSFYRADERRPGSPVRPNVGFEVPASTAKLLHELHPGKRAALMQLQGLMVPGFVGVGDGKKDEMVEWSINQAIRDLIAGRDEKVEANQLAGASIGALRAALEEAESKQPSRGKEGEAGAAKQAAG